MKSWGLCHKNTIPISAAYDMAFISDSLCVPWGSCKLMHGLCYVVCFQKVLIWKLQCEMKLSFKWKVLQLSMLATSWKRRLLCGFQFYKVFRFCRRLSAFFLYKEKIKFDNMYPTYVKVFAVIKMKNEGIAWFVCLVNHPKNGFRLLRYHIIYFLLKDAVLTSAAFSSFSNTITAILII